MTDDTVLAATGLGKRYRRRWALSDCTLTVPAGRVVGLAVMVVVAFALGWIVAGRALRPLSLIHI